MTRSLRLYLGAASLLVAVACSPAAPNGGTAITDLTPTSGPAGSPVTVHVTGSGFTPKLAQGLGDSDPHVDAELTIQVDGHAVPTTFVSDTEVTAQLPATLTLGDHTVTAAKGAQVFSGALTYSAVHPLTLTVQAPASATKGQQIPVTVHVANAGSTDLAIVITASATDVLSVSYSNGGTVAAGGSQDYTFNVDALSTGTGTLNLAVQPDASTSLPNLQKQVTIDVSAGGTGSSSGSTGSSSGSTGSSTSSSSGSTSSSSGSTSSSSGSSSATSSSSGSSGTTAATSSSSSSSGSSGSSSSSSSSSSSAGSTGTTATTGSSSGSGSSSSSSGSGSGSSSSSSGSGSGSSGSSSSGSGSGSGSGSSSSGSSSGSTGGTSGTVSAVTPGASNVRLQSVVLNWAAPANVDHVSVEVSPAGTNTYTVASSSVLGSSYEVTGLSPFTAYDFRITSYDASNNAGGSVTLSGVSTAFSGTDSDFLATGQTLTGAGGLKFDLAWSASDLAIGLSNGTATLPLGANQALWVAVDTDPSVDATGELRTTTQSANDVIWPFKADYVFELKVTGSGTYLVNERTAGTWTPFSTDVGVAQIAELRIHKSDLGNVAAARIAMIAVDTSTGDTFDLAPVNPAATDVTGFFASLTASLSPGAALFDPTLSATSASAPLSSAAALVTLTVHDASPAVALKVKGSLHPLSYTLGDTTYALVDDGTHGDVTKNDGVYTGVFNFGGASGPLFFKFDDNGTDEPSFTASGVDRIYTLAGTAEALPQLELGAVFAATHSFVTHFVCNACGSPTELRGDVPELGNWGADAGPAPLLDGGTAYWDVTFTNYDFVNGLDAGGGTTQPLLWKAYDGTTSTWEPSSNHSLDDDVINSFTATWTYGNDAGF